ncbi:hypothetical protein DIZ76_017816 [Coccidioides immitis]|nr:hypothetical protein DIZ76_017816 [Coccidioides immitis]
MAHIEPTVDYYALLQVAQTADQASVKSNYKRLAKIKHPDKNPTNPNATRDFQLVRAGLPATPKDSMCALIIDAFDIALGSVSNII